MMPKVKLQFGLRDLMVNSRPLPLRTHQRGGVHGDLCGCPPGFRIRPLFWNTLFDGALSALNTRRFVKAIAYADDMAVLFSARCTFQVEAWFVAKGLGIATEKTEAIILTGLRGRKIIDLPLMGSKVTSVKSIKYLGVRLNNRRNFRAHLEQTASRATRLVGALSGLLPNIRDPSFHPRRFYYSVWESVIGCGGK